MITQSTVDKAALREFKNDLEGMTLDAVQRELSRVTDIIDRETAWQEALVAREREMQREINGKLVTGRGTYRLRNGVTVKVTIYDAGKDIAAWETDKAGKLFRGWGVYGGYMGARDEHPYDIVELLKEDIPKKRNK